MNMLEYTNNLSCNQCEFHHAKLTAQHTKEMLDRWCAGSLSDIIRFSFRLYFSSAMIFWCWCVSFFFFIISTWRSIDNNTINSIFGCSKKKPSIAFIGVMKQDWWWKRAMSSCWLWTRHRENEQAVTCFSFIFTSIFLCIMSLIEVSVHCLDVCIGWAMRVCVAHNRFPKSNPSFDKNAINWKYAHVYGRHVYGWSAKKKTTTTEMKRNETSLEAAISRPISAIDRQKHLIQTS